MCFVNCSDDDTPDDPADTITLNMLNEHNGKTYLGESNVYINEANNFITSKNLRQSRNEALTQSSLPPGYS